MGERYLVTGGAGVIGGELLHLLAEQGATVLSVDRLPLPDPAPPGVEHLRAELAIDDLAPVIAFRPDRILHLAATFERSVETPEFWAQNWSDNAIATHRLIETAGGIPGLEAFVFASSYLVYRTDLYLREEPAADGVALAESAELRPRNLCGAAKLYAEAELDFARSAGSDRFRTVSARIFRVYGRRSRDVVSRWIRAALAGDEIEVYQPENRFDYVHAADVAEGLRRMADDPAASGPINLATGTSRSVGEMLAIVEGATGRRLRATHRPSDDPFEASRADTTHLRETLGWTPPTDLETGIARVVAHEIGARPRD